MERDFEKILREIDWKMLDTPLFNIKFISLSEYVKEVLIPLNQETNEIPEHDRARSLVFAVILEHLKNIVTKIAETKDDRGLDGPNTQLDLRMISNFKTYAMNNTVDDHTTDYIKSEFGDDIDVVEIVGEAGELINRYTLKALLKRQDKIIPDL